MEIRNIRYVLDQGHPTLELEIDGKLAQLHAEPKRILLQNGIVALGENFVGIVPDIEFEGTTLRGCTRDRAVLRAYLQFGKAVRDGTFEPRSVLTE